MSILRQEKNVKSLLEKQDFQDIIESLVAYLNRGQGMVRTISTGIGEVTLILGMEQDFGEFRLNEDNRVIAQLQLTLTIDPDNFISKPETAATGGEENQPA